MEKKLLIILLLIAQGWNISWQAKPKTEKSLGLFTKKEHHYDVQHGSTKSKREAGDGSELLMEVQQQFYSNVEETIDVLGMRQKGEILVHTSNQVGYLRSKKVGVADLCCTKKGVANEQIVPCTTVQSSI